MFNMQKYFGLLQVNFFEDRKQMGEYAALQAAAYIKNLAGIKDEINILFAAAPSQDDFLYALSEDKSIPWGKINAFQLDDYIGIGADAPQRFANYLKRTIFDKVPLKNCFLMDCGNTSSQIETERYSRELKTHRADIAFIGIGENGHIAFNDPGVSDFCDPYWVKEVRLDDRSRIQQVNDGCFHKLELVPATAITLTIPAIMACKKVFCIVPGRSKAQAAFNTLYADISSAYPSTILRRHEDAALFLDNESAAMLASAVPSTGGQA